MLGVRNDGDDGMEEDKKHSQLEVYRNWNVALLMVAHDRLIVHGATD